MINEYKRDCGYYLGELKPYIYLLPKSSTTIKYILDNENIDNSYITDIKANTIKLLNGNSVNYTSNSSYSGRFLIDNSIEIIINEVNGYQYDDILSKLDDEYYIIFETKTNDLFVFSVEFATHYTYTKQIGDNNHSLTIMFQISQNIPSLQIDKSIEIKETELINDIPCEYNFYSVKKLKISNMDDTTISEDIISVLNDKTIKEIDFIKNSVTFSETYDNNQYNYTISFKIPLKNYTNYLKYSLLEFKKNTYACFIYTSLDNSIAISNLFPSYSIESSEDDSAFNVITITLTTISNFSISSEMSSDEMDKVIDENDDNESKNKWKPVYKYDQCINAIFKAHTLLCEYNFKGKPTGNYSCLEGFSSIYNEYNIIEEYDINETKYGFDIIWQDNSCSFYDSCTMDNLPSVITFNGNETKTIHVNSTCNWNLIWTYPTVWEITPTSGTSGEQDITFTYLGSTDNYGFPEIMFEDYTSKRISLIAYMPTNIRYIEDGTICSDTEIDTNEKCEKWVTLEYNKNDNKTYLCDKGNLYYKKQLYKSDKCDGNFYPTNTYEKGDLIEENSDICKEQGEEIWVEVENEFICDVATGCQEWRDIEYNPDDSTTYICKGYDRYSKQELYQSDDCETNWRPLGMFQEGVLVETNSSVCSYNPPSENSDKLQFTWGGDTVFNFKVNSSKNIQTTENPYSHTFAEMGILTNTNSINCKNMFNANFNTGGTLLTFDHFPEIEEFNNGYGMFSSQKDMTTCNMPYQTIGGTDFRYMFRGCSKLTKINFDGWRLFSEGYLNDGMFEGCEALTEISVKNANQTFIEMIQDALFQLNMLGQVTLITK